MTLLEFAALAIVAYVLMRLLSGFSIFMLIYFGVFFIFWYNLLLWYYAP